MTRQMDEVATTVESKMDSFNLVSSTQAKQVKTKHPKDFKMYMHTSHNTPSPGVIGKTLLV